MRRRAWGSRPPGRGFRAEKGFENYDKADRNSNPYAILSIGACLVEDPEQTFYVELIPEHTAATSEALAVTGLSIEELTRRGERPERAMSMFEDWVLTETPAGHRPRWLVAA